MSGTADRAPPRPAPDAIGPYRILRELGAGGMGKVYAATVAERTPGLETGQTVALKVVHPHLLEQPGFFRRFLREAEIGAGVRHENVVRTYLADACLHDGVQQHLLVMEYVEGQTLHDLLAELGRVPEALCRHIGREIAKGLAAIHEAGAVHRDLKPENALITEDHVVKVMDLGVARLTTDDAVRLSQTGAFVGSLQYAAPEQLLGGGKDLDGRVDLHALGLLLYELATATAPFQADDIPSVIQRVLRSVPRPVGELNPQLSPFFEEVVRTLTEKDRERRFYSAAELCRVLADGEQSVWWQRRADALRTETKQPIRRIRIPRETSVHGRDTEIATMRRLYDEAKAGAGRVLLVEGEAGIGKTRLVDEFVARLRRDGEDVDFLFGGYPPGGAATAAGAFAEAFREHLGPEDVESRLATVLDRAAALVPAVAALLEGQPAPTGCTPLTKDSLQTVFVHMARALARERPVILVIDDLHFAPDQGRGLFAALSLGLSGHPALLVGTARPGLDADWISDLARSAGLQRLSVGRMGSDALRGVLEEALGSAQTATVLLPEILERSDGNPFFAFEVLRALRDRQFLARRPDGAWATTGAVVGFSVPRTIRDVVAARLEGLDEAERAFLDVAACSGFEFDPALVGSALGLGRIPSLRTAGHLEKTRGLVRSAGRRFVFDHHQIQEVLLEDLAEPLREEYHLALAEVVEARVGDDPSRADGVSAVAICRHFREGAQARRGVPYLRKAMAHLAGSHRHEAAIALAQPLLDDDDGLLEDEERLAALLGVAERHAYLGHAAEERAALESAIELADRLGVGAQRALSHQRMGSHFVWTAALEQARQQYARGLEIAEECGDRRLIAATSGDVGSTLVTMGELDEAAGYLERSRRIAQEIGDWRIAANAAGNLGSLHHQRGEMELAWKGFEAAAETFEEHGDLLHVAIYTGNAGNVLRDWGRFDLARPRLERALAVAGKVGNRAEQCRGALNLGALLQDCGELSDAIRRYDEALEISRATGARMGGAFALLNIGAVHSLCGNTQRADECLKQARAAFESIGSAPGLATVLAYEASTREREGSDEEGLALLTRRTCSWHGCTRSRADAARLSACSIAPGTWPVLTTSVGCARSRWSSPCWLAAATPTRRSAH
jgi:serine/threonine protein kinase/tetratricopeptide (TPR) repeat protein